MIEYNADTLVSFGGEVKSIGDNKIGGYLVLFSTDKDPDLASDFFSAETDYGTHKSTDILYDHGFDKILKSRSIGTGELSVKDAGIWLEAQLNMRDEYESAVMELVKDGKLGWSSGTASHLVEREERGKSMFIKKWPLGLDASLTPTPCEPRTKAVPLKSLYGDRITVPPISTSINTPREFDRFLRDAGYSKKQATAITLHGFSGLQRDAVDANELKSLQFDLLQSTNVLNALSLEVHYGRGSEKQNCAS